MLNERELSDTLKAFAQNSMNTAKTAKQMYMHKRTVNYRMKIIAKRTGLNPYNFYELCELLKLKEERS